MKIIFISRTWNRLFGMGGRIQRRHLRFGRLVGRGLGRIRKRRRRRLGRLIFGIAQSLIA